MVDDQVNKEDKFDFTDEGEAKYIGLDEARILAIRAANENPGDYGRRYSDVRMVFAPLDDEETEEYYRVILALRPQGTFSGTPGSEEFYVEKLAPTEAEAAIVQRQVLAVPLPERRRRPVVVLLAVAVLVVIVTSGVVGGLYVGGVLSPSESIVDGPANVLLSPQTPAQLVSPDTRVIVDVPANAMSGAATLHYEPESLQTVLRLPDGYSNVVRAFDLTITVDGRAGDAVQLNQPLTVALHLTDADIRLAGGDGANFVIQHFKIKAAIGEPLDTEFDPRNQTVNAQVTSLSVFALTVRSNATPQALVTATPNAIVPKTPLNATPTLAPTGISRPTTTQTPEPTHTPRSTLSASHTPSPTVVAQRTPIPVLGREVNSTASPTSLATLTPSPTLSPTPTAAPTVTPTPTPSPTPTAVFTSTPIPTSSPTPMPATVTPSPTPSLPNLVPFQPERWSAPLVISDTRSPFLDTPPPGGTEFVIGSNVFVHWAIKSESRQAVTQPFQVGIAIDGDLKVTFPVERLDSNEIVRMVNVELSVGSPGQHHFELIVDVDNRIDERNEGDNTFTFDPRWANPTPTATVTPFPTPTPAVAPTSVLRPTATPTTVPTLTPTATRMVTPTVTPINIPTATKTTMPTPTITPTATIAVTPTATNTVAPTPTVAPTATPTMTPTITPTETPTVTPTATNTVTPTPTINSDYRIAFRSNRGPARNWEIYVINAGDSEPTNLTNSGFSDGTPSWSPDGTKIAFYSQRGDSFDIYTMSADGSNQTQITNNATEDSNPAWSPDGTKIAFYTTRGSTDEIYIMNVDGSEQTRLTDQKASGDHHLAWSPDGAKIAFTSRRDGNREIYIMNADGSEQTRLTNNNVDDWHPAWSPDGTQFAFNQNDAIYVMNADGSGRTRLTDDTHNEHPSWSPDGNRIAFTSRRDGNREIYIMNADGSEQTRITNNSDDWDFFPAWSPK